MESEDSPESDIFGRRPTKFCRVYVRVGVMQSGPHKHMIRPLFPRVDEDLEYDDRVCSVI